MFSTWRKAKPELPANIEVEVQDADQRDSELKIARKLGGSTAFP